MEAKFVIFKDPAGQYRFHLEAPDGEIIANSEAYVSKQGCLDEITSVRRYAPRAKLEDKTIPSVGR
jgi:uncharacterized protein YegP (UPF0339 family)